MIKLFSQKKLIQSFEAMKLAILFTACLFLGGMNASSDFKDDAEAILRVLQRNINSIDLLTNCYNTAYQVNGTIENKRDCSAIFAKISKPNNGRRSSLRHSQTLAIHSPTQMHTRRQCRRFHRWGC